MSHLGEYRCWRLQFLEFTMTRPNYLNIRKSKYWACIFGMWPCHGLFVHPSTGGGHAYQTLNWKLPSGSLFMNELHWFVPQLLGFFDRKASGTFRYVRNIFSGGDESVMLWCQFQHKSLSQQEMLRNLLLYWIEIWETHSHWCWNP